MKEIDGIVSDYGGLLDECGPIASDRAPFTTTSGSTAQARF
jgi:hypothetical protein